MSQVNQYLSSLLTESGLGDAQDNVESGRLEISRYIVNKLLSKKFRKWRLDVECLLNIEEEVSAAIDDVRPIRIFFAQGAYKLWRVKSSPKVNWAEFFNISYLLQYIAPIAKVYNPGIELTYFFLTVLPQTHNNLSSEEIASYQQSFENLLNKFRPFLPKNISVRIVTDVDIHTRTKYDRLLAQAMAKAEERFLAWPVAKQADYMRRAWLNIKWKGVQDWTTLTEEQKARLVKRAVLYEYTATQDILIEDKKGKGVILSTLPKEDSIGIGSTYTSVAKHWVGEGVIETSNDTFYPRILSPSQYDLARLKKHIIMKTSVLDLEGFETIEVYPEHFDFTKK